MYDHDLLHILEHAGTRCSTVLDGAAVEFPGILNVESQTGSDDTGQPVAWLVTHLTVSTALAGRLSSAVAGTCDTPASIITLKGVSYQVRDVLADGDGELSKLILARVHAP